MKSDFRIFRSLPPLLFTGFLIVFLLFSAKGFGNSIFDNYAKQNNNSQDTTVLPLFSVMHHNNTKAYLTLEEGKWDSTIVFVGNYLKKYQYAILHLYGNQYLYNYLGTSYKRTGNYFLSSINYKISKVLSDFENDHYLSSCIDLNIGALEMEKRNYDHSISINKDLLSTPNLTDDIGAIALQNIAFASLKKGDVNRAAKSYGTLLTMLQSREIGGEFKKPLFFINYGGYLVSIDQFDEGISFLLKGLKEIRNNPLDQYLYAVGYRDLSQAYIQINKIDSAFHYLDEAINLLTSPKNIINVQPAVEYETVLIETLLRRGKLFIKNWAQSLTNTEILIDAYSDIELAIEKILRLSFTRLSESTRFVIAEKGEELFDLGIYTALRLFEITGDKNYFDQALEWSIQGKSLSLNWLSQKDYIYPIAGIPNDSIYKLKSLREEISQFIDNEELTKDNGEFDLEWLNDVCKNALQYSQLEKWIQNQYDGQRISDKSAQISKVLVPKNFRFETYLGYHDLDSVLIVFGVNRKEKFHYKLKLDQSIRNDIEELKAILSTPRIGVYGKDDIENYSRLSNDIYKVILSPIENHIRSRRIALHVDGVLLGLPFEALVYEKADPGKVTGFKNLKYILNKYTIRYVASPFLTGMDNTHSKGKSKMLLTCYSHNDNSSFRSEVDRITKIDPRFEIIRLNNISDDFQHELNKYDGIHIACHLFAADEDFMETGLACNENLDTVLLPFKDILYSRLNKSDVFLNSCRTGSGPVNHGEGLMSLSLAYTMAGAGSIIQHLWKAPGRASSEIAVNYYSKRKWNMPENTILKSKRIFLKEAEHGHDHPHYWAGIVYYGHRHSTNHIIFFIVGVVFGLILILSITTYVIKRRK